MLMSWTKSKQEECAKLSIPEGEDNKDEREELESRIKQFTALEAQLLMMGAKVDRRRQDLYRARDRSVAAQKSSKASMKKLLWQIVSHNKVF